VDELANGLNKLNNLLEDNDVKFLFRY
jgi:hypothetical protein